MKLFYREIGKGHPLLFLHGLWGASENWLPIAHLLASCFRVFLPDLRNHGRSFHADPMNYEVMSDDIVKFIEALKLPEIPSIVGHSMGGKIGMALLLKRPDLIRKAIIVDIAPIPYPFYNNNFHNKIIDFVTSFPLSTCQNRKEIKNALALYFHSEREQQLILKNIRKPDQGFEWKINGPVIKKHFSEICDWPESFSRSIYHPEILFIKGSYSPMIPDLTTLQKQFPAARLITLPDCSHWIHAEQPEKLAQTIKLFILPK